MRTNEIKTCTREQLADELASAAEYTDDWQTATIDNLRERVYRLHGWDSEYVDGRGWTITCVDGNGVLVLAEPGKYYRDKDEANEAIQLWCDE